MEKVILVTGGTRGIGRATSIVLQESGYKVVAFYAHNDAAAMNLTNEFPDIDVQKVDVANSDMVNQAVKEIINRYGHIDGLVNNAGITKDGYFLMMSAQKWKEVFDINLGGAFNLLKVVLRHMKVRKISGSVVNLASVSGVVGQIGQANYSASKAALIALTKTLAKEMAADNIRVNSVSPGFIETDMTATLRNQEAIQNLIPMQRFGTAREVANVVEFLLSEKSSYITGKNIIVDGGLIND